MSLGVLWSVSFKKEPETMDGGKGKGKATGQIDSGSNEALKDTVAELVRKALAEQLEKARPSISLSPSPLSVICASPISNVTLPPHNQNVHNYVQRGRPGNRG